MTVEGKQAIEKSAGCEDGFAAVGRKKGGGCVGVGVGGREGGQQASQYGVVYVLGTGYGLPPPGTPRHRWDRCGSKMRRARRAPSIGLAKVNRLLFPQPVALTHQPCPGL